MKRIFSISVLFCGILCLFSCNNDTKSTNQNDTNKPINYEGMAEDLCKCMTPLMEIQQKIAALSAEGKKDEIQILLNTVEKMSADGDKCVAELENKYGVIEDENEQKANEAFQKACPTIAAMLNDVADDVTEE